MKTQKRQYLLPFVWGGLILFALAFEVVGTWGQSPAALRLETISFGLITVHDNPREKIEQYLDFVNYVARKLLPTSDIKGRVVVAPTVLHLIRLLNEKKVDFYIGTPYKTFLINEQTGAKLLLRRWKGGVAEYRTFIFARKEGGITRLDELLGKLIAFKDPDSTSGYFLPKAFLVRQGFKLTEKFSFQAIVSPKEIGYLLAHDEENILNWVLVGKVAAGVISDEHLKRFDEKRRVEIAILAETESVPRDLISVRKDLDPALVHRLKEILLTMHQDEDGRAALKKAEKAAKFDLLPGGEEMLYKQIKELFSVLQRK